MAETLQDFLIRIGVDDSEVNAGSRAVTQAVRDMHRSLNSLVGSFNVASDDVGSANKKIGDSTEKAGNRLKTHTGNIRNYFGSLRNELLGFAGITLSIGGALGFVDSMTTKLQGMSNASRQLGVSARDIDGWNRAFQAAGGADNEGQNLLGGFRQSLNGLAQGNVDGRLQALSQLGVQYNPESNVNDLLRQASQRLQHMGNTPREQALAQQLGIDAGGNQGILSGQVQRDQGRYARSSSFDGNFDVQRLAEVRTQLSQTFETIENELMRQGLPALNNFADVISHQLADQNSPVEQAIHSIGDLGNALKSFVSIGNNFAKGLNEFQQGHYMQALRTWGVTGSGSSDSSQHQAQQNSQNASHAILDYAHRHPWLRWLTNLDTNQDDQAYLSRRYGKQSDSVLSNDQQAHDLATYRENSHTSSRYDDLVNRFSKQFGVDPQVMHNLMMAESSGNANASVKNGGQGLFGLTRTGGGAGLGSRIMDPQANIQRGIQYFSQLLKRYHNDYRKATIAYHDGHYGSTPSTDALREMTRVIGAGMSASQHNTYHSGGNTHHETHVGTVNLTGKYADMESIANAVANQTTPSKWAMSASTGQS